MKNKYVKKFKKGFIASLSILFSACLVSALIGMPTHYAIKFNMDWICCFNLLTWPTAIGYTSAYINWICDNF